MEQLKALAQYRDAILLAELAGLLHNVGKLDPNFLASVVCDKGKAEAVNLLKQHNQYVRDYASKRFAKPAEDILDARVKSLLASKTPLAKSQLPAPPGNSALKEREKKAAEEFNKFYRGVGPLSDDQARALSEKILKVCGEEWRLTDLLTLFWDEFFYKPPNDDYQRIYALDPWLRCRPNGLPHLLIHAHGENSGSEKYQIEQDEETGITIHKDVTIGKKSFFENLRIATAFGYEVDIPVWDLQAKRQYLINQLPDLSLNDEKWRCPFQETLQHGLGDTQRPINEITLWDYASSIVALFKTSIAKSFLEGAVVNANLMCWHLLGVHFDGLDYILQATRITDLLGRRQRFQETLDQISTTLTQEIPIASRVYQDENGLFFVVPDSDELNLEDLKSLIEEQLQGSKFDDLRPHIDWSKKPLRGKQLNLGQEINRQEINRQDKVSRPSIDPEKVKEWWQNSATEICTVCGLRPAINRETNYCSICKNNRQSRVQPWLENPNSTIWLEEVADSNGRMALLTGQFPLDHWLNGELVESLALGINERREQPVPKYASFPRIQRIWRTTQAFWREIEDKIKEKNLADNRRLKISLANQPNSQANMTYELNLLGRTRMSVIWDGSYLISIDNLGYIAVQLDIPAPKRKTPADAALEVGVWLDENKQNERSQKRVFKLISDDEKNRQFDIQIANVNHQDVAYATAIPILAEPRTFMALVPADKALGIMQTIKEKYEREMGKVCNRLSLHLGAAYAHRRTPLRAVLDAGQRMLWQKPLAGEKPWRVICKRVNGGTLPERFNSDKDGQFKEWIEISLKGDRSLNWYIPAFMGDGQTKDEWYPYVFFHSDKDGNTNPTQATEKPSRTFKLTKNGQTEAWVHAGELEQGDHIYFTPATFDFEWLDTGARRFEIAYDEQGKRYGRFTRPYLLDELDEMQKAWGMLRTLSKSQLYALRDTIEQKRQDWFPEPEQSLQDEAFKQFCRDVIANIDWKKSIDKEKLTEWAVTGVISDVMEIHVSIMKEKIEASASKEDKANE